jgi:YaiO family outer membrane protein
MTNAGRIRACALAALIVCSVPAAASAGEWDLTGSLSTFTSPDGVGPWRTLTLSDRESIGADKPGIALVDRSDDDAAGAGHSAGVVLDDYHTWSKRFFTYAAVGTASGSVLPTRNAYLEGDVKFGHALAWVFGGGGGIVVNPDGTIQRYLNAGPTWYGNNINVTVRWLPSFTSGRIGTSSALLTLAAGPVGKTVGTLTLLAGSEPPYGIISTTTLLESPQSVLFAGIDVKHWVNPKGGYHAGIEIERLNDRASGDLLYVRRALNVGIFRQIGRGPAP